MSFKRLRKKFTPEDLADAFVFPVRLTAKQKKVADELLAAVRKCTQEGASDETIFSLNAYGLRLHIENYFEQKAFDPDLTFGFFLKMYVELLEKNSKEFAKEISIDETMLNQLINGECMPLEYISIRLELHSGNNIPATHWLKLVERQRLHEIANNTELRKKEKPFVNNTLPLKQSA